MLLPLLPVPAPSAAQGGLGLGGGHAALGPQGGPSRAWVSTPALRLGSAATRGLGA